MPRFTVKDASDPRFERDFVVDRDNAYTPTDAETAYFAKVNEILQKLADDQRQDQESNQIQHRLFEARHEYRNENVNQLRSIVEQFADETMALDKATTATDEVENNYPKYRPDFAADRANW